jgi:KRAB domain-containing zinc finger protein
VCSEYGKAFFRKLKLTEQKTPMGNKPHVHSICSKVFFRKFKLTEYQRTHTGEKPYEWTECAKPSARRQSYDTFAKKQKRRKTPCVQWAWERFLQKIALVLH